MTDVLAGLVVVLAVVLVVGLGEADRVVVVVGVPLDRVAEQARGAAPHQHANLVARLGGRF